MTPKTPNIQTTTASESGLGSITTPDPLHDFTATGQFGNFFRYKRIQSPTVIYYHLDQPNIVCLVEQF